MALAAFLGLALGVAALVISLALLSGFQYHIRGRLLEETPHLLVLPSGRGDFALAEGIGERIGRVAGVVSVSPVVRGRLWISVRGQSVPAEGVGREGVEGLRLDPQHARTLGAYTGDEVLLVSSRSRLSPLGPVPIVASMRIEEVLSSPAGRRAPEVVLPLQEAGRLFGVPAGGASGYEVRLADPATSSRAAEAIRAVLGAGVRVRTWEELNEALVLALRLERIVLFATVSLIVIVAGLNLAATAAVLAATRTGDAAVLSVLGATPAQVASVFLLAGGLVGAFGTAAGLALGASIAALLDRTGAIPLPERLFALSHVPFRLDPVDLLAVALLSLAWSVAVSWGPARTAARGNVAEVLRGA